MKNIIRNIIHHAAAQAAADRLRSYLDRGRRFETLTDDFVSVAYVKAITTCASTSPPWAILPELYDLVDEASLRGLNLSHHEVREELETIRSMVIAKLTRDGFDEQAYREMEQAVAAYREWQDRKN